MALSDCHCPVVEFSFLFSFLLQNHGEEISLRLRTDDLKGFRKYESIKKTLLHELVSYMLGFLELETQATRAELTHTNTERNRNRILLFYQRMRPGKDNNSPLTGSVVTPVYTYKNKTDSPFYNTTPLLFILFLKQTFIPQQPTNRLTN